jgi:hypothetical protein
MPWPGEQSRPDRILITGSCFDIKTVHNLEGAFPNDYKKHYYWRIITKRTIDWLPDFAVQINFFHPINIFGAFWILYLIKVNKKILILLTTTMILFFYYVAFYYHFMEEEFFSSDHKIVIADLTIKCKK